MGEGGAALIVANQVIIFADPTVAILSPNALPHLDNSEVLRFLIAVHVDIDRFPPCPLLVGFNATGKASSRFYVPNKGGNKGGIGGEFAKRTS
jgi:hypothetical protein